jgi:uncharacterized protein YecE (DUF72 family)
MSGGDIRIGISGWTYKPWRGVFYPPKLRQQDELRFAATQVSAIEINGTFYGLQRPESFARWRDETPEDFVFSVKAPRFITHTKRLRDVATPVANFLASGLLRLGPKLGPILWQFPPTMQFDAGLFEAFLSMLPHDTAAAAVLARRHDDRMTGRSALQAESEHKLRHAVEIRHESFRVPEFLRLLQKYKIALVCADTNKWPRLMDVTADLIYCRLHGPAELYASGYDNKALDFWRGNIACWAAGGEPKAAERIGAPSKPQKAGRDVFVFFDNDLKVRAPHDAVCLIQLLGLPSRLEEEKKMAKESKAQKATIKRVMHEAEKGELKTSAGRQVKSRKQAVAIALNEAGASKQETPANNKANLRKTKSRERKAAR